MTISSRGVAGRVVEQTGQSKRQHGKPLQDNITVHGLGSGSFFGRTALVTRQTSNPKNVPDPFVCWNIAHPVNVYQDNHSLTRER